MGLTASRFTVLIAVGKKLFLKPVDLVEMDLQCLPEGGEAGRGGGLLKQLT